MNPDYRRYVDNEYKDHRVYMALAGVERNGPRRKTLEKLADVEGRHYRFWLLHIPGHKPSVSGAYIRLMVLLRMLFGVTFVVKLLENHEKKTLEQYKQLVLDEAFDNNSRDALNKIIEEEGEIEKKLVSSIDEAVVRYLGFMMLGVADAIVELTGVQAGFLGVTDSPLVAGIAGLIVGVAAAISMGAASYLQARQGMSEKPVVSGVVTGLLYMLTVIALASPYFIIKDIFIAFASAITLALLLIALLTFYTSVIQERSFRNEYLLNVSILLVVAFGTFFLGKLLGAYFGVGSLLPA